MLNVLGAIVVFFAAIAYLALLQQRQPGYGTTPYWDIFFGFTKSAIGFCFFAALCILGIFLLVGGRF